MITGCGLKNNSEVEHQHHSETPVKRTKVDHSKMDHSPLQHDGNPSMGHVGHDHHAMMAADFKKRFYVVLVLTIPIMLLPEMIQHFMGVQWQFQASPCLMFALSTMVFFYGGQPFLKGLAEEVKAKNPGMMFLIGFAISVAYAYVAYGVAVVFGLKGMDFFWELATLILVMLLGHWIEMRSIAGASKDLELLVVVICCPHALGLAGYISLSNQIRPESADAVLMSLSTVVVAINAGFLKVRK